MDVDIRRAGLNREQRRQQVPRGLVALEYEFTPVRVFVVWHPRFPGGEMAFQALYDWLGGQNHDLYRRGLGLPVQAWTSLAEDEAPKEIPNHTQTLTIIVPILDGEFLGRKNWRDWLASCAQPEKDAANSIVILPWAVHQAATIVPGIGSLQLLGSGPCDAAQLCRRVTEACVVRMRNPHEPRPIRIFLSYARLDGSEIAREVRKALQNYGNLSVFFDEHDLQPGDNWRETLTEELAQGSAMFAIVSDAYANRAWCREELREFRKPTKDENSRIWRLRPVYILDSLSGVSTRSMFEVGNAPAARWNPEYADKVVDQLVREMLFAEINCADLQIVEQHEDIHFINWVPDTWTLLQVFRSPHEQPIGRLAYPGDGLPRIELARLSELFPEVSLVSFEALKRETAMVTGRAGRFGRSTIPRTPVLLSVSDPPSEDLASRGMGRCHLDDAAIRIARALLSDNFDIMYGGRPREGFTSAFQDDSGAVVVEARMINCLGWPYTRNLTAGQVADGFGVTRFVRTPWPKESGASESDPWAMAESATYTRRAIIRGGLSDTDGKVIPPPAGLIAVGGQVEGFSGFLPGVAEEIAIALEEKLPVFVLGGFGGAAGEVAKILSGTSLSPWSFERFTENEKYALLVAAAASRGDTNELKQKISWLNETLRCANLCNGLTVDDNAILWHTADIGLAAALVTKGLCVVSSD